MKILIYSTKNLENYYVHAYETWKKYLSQYSDIRNYGEGYSDFYGWDIDANELYSKIDFIPDLELWCGGPGNKKPQYIDDIHILKNQDKNIPKLILITDYWEIVRNSDLETWRSREKILEEYGVIGYFTFYCQAKEWLLNIVKTCFKKIIVFSYIYDEDFNKYIDLEKKWDINLQFKYRSYPFRTKVFKEITKKKYNYFHINKNHRYKIIEGDDDPLNHYFNGGNPVTNFAKLLSSCKITITDGYTKYCSKKKLWKTIDTDLFNVRYPQVLASSGVLFCPKIEITNLEQIIPDYHYVDIDENNFLEKIDYYLKNEKELKEISKNANEWVKKNCSGDVVCKKFLQDIKNIF